MLSKHQQSNIYIIQVNQYIYVGVASNFKKRIAAHKRDLENNTHHNIILQRLYNKYNTFEYTILESNLSHDEAHGAEIFWIAYFRYISVNVINLTNGGEGCIGRKASPETTEKIRLAHIGKKRSLQARENMRNAQLGKKRLKESIEKGASKLRGKPKQQHVIDSVVKSRQKTYDVILLDPFGNTYGPITNVAAFAREHAIHRRQILDVINGKDKQHKGWRLKT